MIETREPDRQSLLTEIQGTLSTAFPGQSPEDKKMKSDILEATFGTRQWTKVCDLPS